MVFFDVIQIVNCLPFCYCVLIGEKDGGCNGIVLKIYSLKNTLTLTHTHTHKTNKKQQLSTVINLFTSETRMTARLFYVFGSCLKPLFSKYLCKRNKCQIYCRISPEGIKIIYISFKGWGYLIFRCMAKLIVIEVWVPLNSVWLYGVLVLLEKAAGKKLFLFCSSLIW